MNHHHKIYCVCLVALFVTTIYADRIFYGAADASAAAPLDDHRFIVADDEDNTLRIYDWNRPDSLPLVEIDLTQKLAVTEENPETDIEGVTRLGNRLVWVTSHGRSKKGNFRPNRCRLFATTINPDGKITVDGSYSNLLSDLIAYDKTWNLGLARAIGTQNSAINMDKVEDLAPKKHGLNIEGLAAVADGKTLLIAFRNPRPVREGKEMALIIPVANPEDVLLKTAKPILKTPICLFRFIPMHRRTSGPMGWRPLF